MPWLLTGPAALLLLAHFSFDADFQDWMLDAMSAYEPAQIGLGF